MSSAARSSLVKELRELAATSLQPLPDYQCLSGMPDALNDKLIVTMRDDATGRVAAFVSAVYMQIALRAGDPPRTVLHMGLTCIAPALRRQGLMVPLFMHLYIYLHDLPECHDGLWITSLAEVPSTLGKIAEGMVDVYPSPSFPEPSDVHLRIARAVDERYRSAMGISPDAQFDAENFVFRGSNPPGSCFRKDSEDPQFYHRDAEINEFYRRLLGRDEGNEVLQVGFLDWERILGSGRKHAQTESYTDEVKTKL
ncbi:hypothetical protein PsYK624_081630 [Phanerochaete sordida]|uniref:Uncharacterized protein n=1 Tax=Phanerochaete sordida TaxID=48140 RepID=A0A9P3GDX3_9APHY|nr:hypothetical protein PsYK624_081630 [Phanerochaete sordida]